MSMLLTQPPLASVGWGDAVNLNFQTLQDFCNGLPGAPVQGLAGARYDGSLAGVAVKATTGQVSLAGGIGDTGFSTSPSFVLCWYLSPKSSAAPSPLPVYYSGTWHISNGDVADSTSVVGWLALEAV